MRGKSKCKILKQIRQKIAQENDIPLVTKECTYQGECSGTCPRCEAELRYLEQQLARRQQLGKTVTVAALSLGLVAGAAGCSRQVMGVVPLEGEPLASLTEPTELDGDVAWEDETTAGAPTAPLCTTDPTSNELWESTGVLSTEELVMGELPEATDDAAFELPGDVAFSEGEGND